MKKQKFYGVLLLLISISLTSCSEETQTESNSSTKLKSTTIIAADLEPVGIMHNDLLEKLYSGYVNDVPNQGETKDYAINLYTNELNKLDDTQNSIELGVKGMKWNMDNFIPNESSYITDQSFYKSDSIVNLLSENEKYYLDYLYEVVVNDSTETVEKTIGNIQVIESLISNQNFSDEQLITLYSATNIAKYSLQYWNENLDKWSELDESYGTPIMAGRVSRQAGRNFRLVAGADIAGGVSMAAYTWVVNSVPGAGQASYMGAIVGGAVCGSTLMAIGIIGKKYFSDWF